MKMIRWWGLVAFVVVIMVFLLAAYLLAPYLIKNSIEEVGSEALGAKVELASVDISLIPLSVALNHFQATDPDQPMQNLVESEKIKFGVDTGALLWKKLIIDELVLSGVKMGSPRSTSGAIEGGRKSAQLVSSLEASLPEVEDIDVKKMVDNADLLTVKRIAELKSSQQKIRQQWQQALDKKAFDQRVDTIKSEYARLSARAKDNKFNLLKDRKKWKALKRSINAERKQIKALSGKLSEDKATLADQLKAVKNGPADDLDKLMNQFGVGSGMQGLVDRYLGSQYRPWVERALQMVKSVKSKPTEEPQSDRAISVGQRVYFKDHLQLPELLVKKVLLSGGGDDWTLDGQGEEVAYLPWLNDKPAQLSVELAGKGQAKASINSDWPSPSSMRTKVDARVSNWPLQAMQFMQTEQGSWQLNAGLLSADVKGQLTLEKIDLSASFSISSPKLSAPQGLTDWQQSLAESVNQQSKISFKLIAQGSLEEPEIKLDSSIEKLFQQVIGAKIKQKSQKLTGKVQQAIADKVGDLSSLESLDGDFANWQNQLADKDGLLKNLLGKIKL